jgi:arsenate reductase
MSEKTYSILFLCTGNSARSIMAEAITNRMGAGRFTAYSAGSHPKGEVHPNTLETLARFGVPTAGLHPKSWDEFSGAEAPELNFVFTVCSNAAGEVCPIWAGQTVTAHWGIPDPAAVSGMADERQRAFLDAYRMLEERIAAFADLSMDSLDRLSLQNKLDDIGRFGSESSSSAKQPGKVARAGK